MKLHLTKRNIDGLDLPSKKEIVAWDTKTPGFGMRLKPSGRRAFIFQYFWNGTSKRMTIGDYGVSGGLTPDMARKRVEELRQKVRDGEDPADSKSKAKKAITVSELCDLYIEAARAGTLPKKKQLKPSTIEIDTGRIKRHIVPLLGKDKADTVTATKVYDFIEGVKTGKTAGQFKANHTIARVTGGDGAARRTTALLSAIYTFGKRKGYVSVNPCVDVVRSSDRKIKFALGKKGYAALGAQLGKSAAAGEVWQFVAAARLIALTGCRKNEIIQLGWHEVDFEGSMLRFAEDFDVKPRRTIKGGLIRPLSDLAIELLLEIHESLPEGLPRPRYVFTGIVNSEKPYGNFEKSWKQWISVPGAEGSILTPHRLRDALGAVAGELGYSDNVIADILGHARRSQTSKYVKLDEIVMKAANAAASQIDSWMRGITSG